MKHVAPLRYEVIFKKAFCQPEVFTAFVKDFTGVDLEIDRVETEKRLDPPIGQIDSRFDLFAEDRKNRVIVDIQHVRFPDHYDRFLHYHCAALLDQASNAQDYRPKMRVLTLVVLTSGDRQRKDIATIDFDPKDLNGQPLNEIHHRVVYLCPPYVNDATPAPYREWLLAIQDSMDEYVDETTYQHPAIQQIFTAIARTTLTPQERARLKDEYGYEQISKDQFAKGMKKGIQQVVRQMLHKKLAPEFIADMTGLPVALIQQLAQDQADGPPNRDADIFEYDEE